MENWKLWLLAVCLLGIILLGVHSLMTWEGRYVATVFDRTGDIAVDANRCTVQQADGFRVIKCR